MESRDRPFWWDGSLVSSVIIVGMVDRFYLFLTGATWGWSVEGLRKWLHKISTYGRFRLSAAELVAGSHVGSGSE